MKEHLCAHFERYPKMQLADIVKLLYQSEFAGGHLIDHGKDSVLRLNAECLETAPCSPDAYEDIGSGLCRLHLWHAVQEGISMETVSRLFAATAKAVRGSTANYKNKLNMLKRYCAAGDLPFNPHTLTAYISSLKKQGWPPISHSDTYRAAYHPAYRVVKKAYCDYIKAFDKIEKRLKNNKLMTVAIDGPSGAGKSTLAALLSEVYDCSVFHMDNFFLPKSKKTAQRLAEPGGNIDYERFLKEILIPLSSNKPIEFCAYDCTKDALGAPIHIEPAPLCIIEGVYSLHPALKSSYDLKIFLDIERRAQLARIRTRSGEALYTRFINEWIPLEDQYFMTFDIKRQCDMVHLDSALT